MSTKERGPTRPQYDTLRKHAIDRLRNEHGLRTEVMPTERIEDDEGVGRLTGYWARSSAFARWLWGALWALTLGTVLALTNLPGLSPHTSRGVRHVGNAVQGLGAACILVAEVSRRRGRTRAMVELHLDRARSVTSGAMRELHRAAAGAETWLVAHGELEADTLECARELGIRCFALEKHGLRERGHHAQLPNG
jgi:hypothetical protein